MLKEYGGIPCALSFRKMTTPVLFGLLLGLPWLFSVNAIIHVRKSKITIGDPELGEQSTEIIGPELVHRADRFMLSYKRVQKWLAPKVEAESSESEADEDSSSEELNDAAESERDF